MPRFRAIKKNHMRQTMPSFGALENIPNSQLEYTTDKANASGSIKHKHYREDSETKMGA
jgi:hypothetical protein